MDKRKMKHKSLNIIMIMLLVAIIGSGCSTSNEANDSDKGIFVDPESTIEAGNYIVGEDINAGTYLLLAEDEYSFFTIKSDTSETSESYINSNAFSYNYYIEIKDGNYLELGLCKAIPIEEAPILDELNSAGMFKVGRDMPAGKYVLIANDPTTYSEVLASLATPDVEQTAYYDIVTALDYADESKLVSDIALKPTEVTLAKGQYITFELSTIKAK
jgi:hypothetical protein